MLKLLTVVEDRGGLLNCSVRVFLARIFAVFSKFIFRRKNGFFRTLALYLLDVDNLNCGHILLKLKKELVVLPLALRVFWINNFANIVHF